MAGNDDVVMRAFLAALAKVAHPPQPEYKGIPEAMKPLMPIFITTKMARERAHEQMPLAGLIFDMMAFFRPLKIPFDLIHFYFPHKSKEDVDKALNILDKLALIMYHKTYVDAHQAIQEVTVESLKLKSRILVTFTYFIQLSMKILREQRAHPEFRQFVYHILKSTDYMTAITNEKDHTEFKLMLVDILIDDNCWYSKTGKLLEETLGETKKRSGQCSSDALMIQVRMAHLKTNKQEYEEARGILEEVLTKLVGKHGEEHRYVFKTQMTMGRLFVEQGDFEEGMELLREVQGKQKKFLGETHEDTKATTEVIQDSINEKERREKYAKQKEAEELAQKMKELTTEDSEDVA